MHIGITHLIHELHTLNIEQKLAVDDIRGRIVELEKTLASLKSQQIVQILISKIIIRQLSDRNKNLLPEPKIVSLCFTCPVWLTQDPFLWKVLWVN